MSDLSAREWTTAVETELGLRGSEDSPQGLEALDRLADRVTEQVGDRAALRTAFLVGVAAGRAQDPPVAAQDIAQKLGAMAEGWHADAERGVPSNDQSRRA
jgi:aconitase B